MPEETLEQVRLLSNLEIEPPQAAADRAVRPARAGRGARQALPAPAEGPHHAQLPHPAAVADEVAKYVSFRMRAAGYKGPDVFSPAAIARSRAPSSGLTRRINILCDKSLLAAFAANAHAVTPREVRAAIADSDFAPIAGPRARAGRALVAAALLAFGAAAGAGLYLLARSRRPRTGCRACRSAACRAACREAGARCCDFAAALQRRRQSRLRPRPRRRRPPPRPRRRKRRLAPQMLGARAAAPLRGLLRRAAIRCCASALRRRASGSASEPDGRYSVELFITENSDPARVERFLHARARPGAAIGDQRDSGCRPGRATACASATACSRAARPPRRPRRRLPPKYQNAFKFQLRSFAELRARALTCDAEVRKRLPYSCLAAFSANEAVLC